MDFAFSEEQEQLRAVAREFLADRYRRRASARSPTGDRRRTPRCGRSSPSWAGWTPSSTCSTRRCWPRRRATRCCRRRTSPASRSPAPAGCGAPRSRPGDAGLGRRRRPHAAGRRDDRVLPGRRRRRRLAADRGQARGAGPGRRRRPRWSPRATTTGSAVPRSTWPTTPSVHALSDAGRHAAAGRAAARRHPGRAAGGRRRRGRCGRSADARVAAAGLRGDRRHAARPGPRGRVREEPEPVRPPDRLVPGACRTGWRTSYMALALARSLAYRAAWCVAEDDPARQAVARRRVAAARAAVGGCENAIQG